MTDQLDLFEAPTKRNKAVYEQDDKVYIKLYKDEVKEVTERLSHLLGSGVLIKKNCDFWLVDFNGKYEWVEQKRLTLLE